MNQNILVYIIVTLAVFYTIYLIIRRVKKIKNNQTDCDCCQKKCGKNER